MVIYPLTRRVVSLCWGGIQTVALLNYYLKLGWKKMVSKIYIINNNIYVIVRWLYILIFKE